MDSLIRDCDKLSKHQTASIQKAIKSVDGVLKAIEDLKRKRAANTANEGNFEADLVAIKSKVDKAQTNVSDQFKDLYTNVSKYGKHVDKVFKLDLGIVGESKAFEDKREILAQSILLHFLREGNFDMAKNFADEAQLQLPQDIQVQFEDMYRTVAEIRSDQHDLTRAISWAVVNRSKLEALGIQLEFSLHRLRFLQLVELGMTTEALFYAREWFPRFANPQQQEEEEKEEQREEQQQSDSQNDSSNKRSSWVTGAGHVEQQQNAMAVDRHHHYDSSDDSDDDCDRETAKPQDSSDDSDEWAVGVLPMLASQLEEIQHLMGIFIYAKRLHTSPYANLFNEQRWEDGAHAFASAFCTLLGLSSTSPLSVTIGAGARALPIVCKVSNLLKEKRVEWSQQNELAVEVPLPDNMRFHSIFACPVSKEQATVSNPPMMMPCGHVVCKASLDKLARGVRPGSVASGRFKCPYCPGMSSLADAKRVYF
ncbi:hypothetical protein GGI12_002054 [Dipsacomyces acuminosporus]|nr:hypothetical protein GGI12_002054 [Dipsacomyces acuminosporus]